MCPNEKMKNWKSHPIESIVVSEVSIKTEIMASSLAQNFCKTASCPSSEKLLQFRRHRLAIRERVEIEIHLRGCDFCSAELQLLMCHRSSPEEYRTVEMPGQLRRLAEDLLTRSTPLLTPIAFNNSRHSH